MHRTTFLIPTSSADGNYRRCKEYDSETTVGDTYTSEGFEDEHPLARIWHFFCFYTASMIHGIYKTDVFTDIVKRIDTINGVYY